MQEAQRFLRYVIPGLVFLVELIFYFFISSNRSNFFGLIKLLFDRDIFSTVFTIFLASGGLGFIFGIFYYTIIWFLPLASNFNAFVKKAIDNGWLKLEEYSDNIKLINPRKRHYLIVNSILDMMITDPNESQEANNRIKKMGDIINSQGTSCISSICALSVWFYFHKFIFPNNNMICYDYVLLLIGFIIFIIHIINFRHVVKDHQTMIGMVFLNYLHKLYENDYSKKSKKNDKKNIALKYFVVVQSQERICISKNETGLTKTYES